MCTPGGGWYQRSEVRDGGTTDPADDKAGGEEDRAGGCGHNDRAAVRGRAGGCY